MTLRGVFAGLAVPMMLAADRLTSTVPVPTTGPGAVGEVEWERVK